MNKIVKKSYPQQIAEFIEQKIKAGEYQIGDKLPTEPELVEMFGVSRNTLREAVQSLTQAGLLETRQGDGTYVVATERLQVDIYNIMNETNMEEVIEVRNLLEKHIVVSAARNRTEADLAEIETLLALRKKESGSVRETTQADLNFHTGIARATHNHLVSNLYRYVSEYFSEYIYKKLYSEELDQTHMDEIHDRLFEAIRDQDEKLALACINEIIEI